MEGVIMKLHRYYYPDGNFELLYLRDYYPVDMYKQEFYNNHCNRLLDFRQNLDQIRKELDLNPPLMPPQDVIDEVSLILTITGFKEKIEKIRDSQEEK